MRDLKFEILPSELLAAFQAQVNYDIELCLKHVFTCKNLETRAMLLP